MAKMSEQGANPKSVPGVGVNEPFQTLDVAQIALESAHIGIWIIDVTTRAFLPSSFTKELFGYALDKNMSFNEALAQIPPKHRPGAVRAIENAFTKRENFAVEFPVHLSGEKKHRWLSVVGGCSNSADATCYFSGVVMDITEQKHNDLRKGNFIGMVSHELKTPLTALKAYIQMLNNWAKKQKDQFSIGALTKVERQVKKMVNMINGLLNLSGAESGKIHLNKEYFLLNALISEVIDEMQFITSSDNIVMQPCEAVKVHADREKIEQVIINLLSNAAKYSEKNSTIEITCSPVANRVRVMVKDKGMGIKPEHIPLLFTPHYRVETEETEKISGFGIGLYLCSEIIKRHNGLIWAESEIGKGSTFVFELPLN